MNSNVKGAKIVTVEEMLRIDPNYIPRGSPPTQLQERDVLSLLAQMPEIPAAAAAASAIVTEQLRIIFFRRMMETDALLEDSEIAREAYVNFIVRLFNSALCKDGTALGQLTASAESCALTQSTLKTKKSVTNSASIRLQGALTHLTSLLHAQEIPMDRNMSVHFLFKMTARQIIDLSRVFVRVTLDSLLDKKRTTIAQLSRSYKTTNTDKLPFNVCYDVYSATDPVKRAYDHNSYYLRLYFDKKKLYAAQLTPYKITKILLQHDELNTSCRIIPSAFSDAFIDIYSTSHKTNIEGQKTDLYYIIYEKVRMVVLQGIPEIEALAPQTVAYQTLFTGIRKLQRWDYFDGNGNEYVLEYDLTSMANHNYPSYVLIEDTLLKAGVVIKDRLYKPYTGRLYAYIIEMPLLLTSAGLNKRLKALDYKHTLYSVEDNVLWYKDDVKDVDFAAVETKLEENGLIITEYLEQEGEVVGYRIQAVEIDLAEAIQSLPSIDRDYVYAVLKGSNLERVCQYPWVDSSRVTTNSIPIMSHYFGIEVSRNYFIYDYVANKNAVDAISQSRYTFVVADDMAYDGIPLGISFHGNAKKSGNDFITLGTISRASEVFARAASRKETAIITTNPASILTSGEIFLGASAPVVMHPSKEKILAKLAAIRDRGKITLQDANAITKDRTNPELVNSTQIVSTKDLIRPTILPLKEVVIKEVDKEAAPPRPYYAPFVMPRVSKEILEDLALPLLITDKPELNSGTIISEYECLSLIERVYTQGSFDVIKVFNAVKVKTSVYQSRFSEYLEEEYYDADQEEDLAESEYEFVERPRFVTNPIMKVSTVI